MKYCLCAGILAWVFDILGFKGIFSKIFGLNYHVSTKNAFLQRAEPGDSNLDHDFRYADHLEVKISQFHPNHIIYREVYFLKWVSFT